MLGIFNKYEAELHAALRVMTGLMFLQHGTQKLLEFPAKFPYPLSGLLNAAGTIEIVGGILFIIGFQTRWVAFILAGFAAVAYFMAHATKGFFPILNGGELAVLYCFIFLYFTATGAGKWSVDNR